MSVNGWIKMRRAKRYHYHDRSSLSLCRRGVYRKDDWMAWASHADNDPQNCKTCMKKLAILKTEGRIA